MYDRILVPTDGQPGTDDAVARGLYLARTFDATLHALSVVDAADTPTQPRDRTRGETALEDVREWGTDLSVGVVTERREGDPQLAIREYAAEAGIDLVLMGIRARDTDETYVGSTTRRVLAGSPAPVIAVAPDDDTIPDPGYGAFDRVVIPTDGSDAAERAATHGLTVAEHYGAGIRVVYVVDTTTHELADTSRSILGPLREGGRNALETIAERARDRSLPVSTAMLEGTPAAEIRSYTDGTGADLVVIGTHGTGTGPEQPLGSTASRLLRRSAVPVLTVNERV